MKNELQEQFGNIDVYLFDQLHRGNIRPGMRILDAGCGAGRNIYFVMRAGYEVCGIDSSPDAIESVRALAGKVAPHLDPKSFRVEAIQEMTFKEDSFDVVIANAVLHFANDDEQFHEMLDSLARVLRPRGLLFTRLATSIGIESTIEHLEGRRYRLPDQSERYLADEAMLVAATERLGATLVDPLKTTVVQNLRAMTTWVLRFPA